MGRAPLPPCVPGLCYVYDGTWEGWLCCVLRSYLDREIPERIVPAGGEEASSLFGCREIRTDEAGAAASGKAWKNGWDCRLYGPCSGLFVPACRRRSGACCS